MLAHEKLQVYGKSLAFVTAASAFSSAWSKKHAVVDQFDRALESLILNLADSARFRSGPRKLGALDYALRSGLECAGCLDIAGIKGLLLHKPEYQHSDSTTYFGSRALSHCLSRYYWRVHGYSYQSVGLPCPLHGRACSFSLQLIRKNTTAIGGSSFWFGFVHYLALFFTHGGSADGGSAEKLHMRPANNAHSVDAPIACVFHIVHPWRRATDAQR